MSKLTNFLLAPLLCAGTIFAGTFWDLKVGNRTAIIYAPDKRDKPALVIGMHGMGGWPGWAKDAMKYDKLADTANFVVAYPGSDGSTWDLGSSKDVNFILAVIDSMYNRYQIDRNRVYASGFSMGGMMSWYLSCKVPDKIAAIVGGNGFPLGGMSGCSEVRHVPALQIHGNCDYFVKYTDFVNSFMPAQRTRYGCPATSQKTNPYPDGVNGRNSQQIASGTKSYMDYYGPCEKNGLTSELSLITVNGMLHDWATPDKANTNDQAECPGYLGKPLEVNGTWEAWNFMKKHSLTGSVPVVTIPAHRDTIFNGGFDQGSLGWTLNTWSGTAQGSVVSNEYKIAITAAGTSNSGIQLVQNGLILVKGKSYQVSFDAYASANRTLEANMELDVDPWTSYLPALKSFDLTTTKTTYTYSFDMTNATDSNARISFNAGASTETIFLDKIILKEVQGPVFARDAKVQNRFVTVSQHGSLLEVARQGAPGTTVSVGLYDLMGKPVRSGQLQASWQTDLNGLSQGIYFVKVEEHGKTIYNSKIMIGK